jgi:hypothetical protein
MEVIAPEENQNVNLNKNSGELNQKNLFLKLIDFINSFIFELVLIGLFSIIIVTVLNYFALVPLSSVFPILSFLPQQNSVQKVINTTSQDDIAFFSNNFTNLSACNNTDADKNIILNQIIICSNPQKFSNLAKDVDYQYVTSDPSVISDKGVQINLALKARNNGKDDVGIMFGGGATENRFYLVYKQDQKAWGLTYLFASKSSDFIPIYSPDSTSIAQRAYFSINVTADGKTISVVFPNGIVYSYNGDKNFYAKEGSLPLTAVLPKNSEITIYSLNYYTPQ